MLLLVIFASGCTQQNNQTTGQSVNQSEVSRLPVPHLFRVVKYLKSTLLMVITYLRLLHGPQRPKTKSFTITCEDPDASGADGAFFHWIVFDIPGKCDQVAEGIPNQRTLDNGANREPMT